MTIRELMRVISGKRDDCFRIIQTINPKKSDFDIYDFDYIRNIETRLNNRRRKHSIFMLPALNIVLTPFFKLAY